MADYKPLDQVIAAARQANEEREQFQLGKLLVHEIDKRLAETDDLIRLGELIGCSLRSMRYAIKVYRLAQQVGLTEDDVARIGWTKLAVVASSVEEKVTKDEVITLCEGRTVTELRAAMAGVAGAVKIVTFSLNKTQRRQLEAALVRYGAVRTGRALSGKEAALMKIIEDKA